MLASLFYWTVQSKELSHTSVPNHERVWTAIHTMQLLANINQTLLNTPNVFQIRLRAHSPLISDLGVLVYLDYKYVKNESVVKSWICVASVWAWTTLLNCSLSNVLNNVTWKWSTDNLLSFLDGNERRVSGCRRFLEQLYALPIKSVEEWPEMWI